MGKKKNKKPLQKAVSKKTRQPKLIKQAQKNGVSPALWVLAMAAMCWTLILYIPSLDNDFIKNWDDNGYVLEHELIQDLNGENIRTIFNTSTFYKGNYHPLTTFSYALEYKAAGSNPALYHRNNLILHLLNVILVFIFIYVLSKNRWISFFTALLFGIHPMHVESVAWISERKDVLFTFFYLMGLIFYLRYKDLNKSKAFYYLLSLVVFVLSLMSKSAAVSFPVILIFIDIYRKKHWNWKLIAEKIPFFALSVYFGILAIFSQDATGAIQDLTPMYSVVERLFIASYALCVYLYKLIIPLNLSAMYPYPGKAGEMLPWYFFIMPVVVLALTFFIFYFRKMRPYLVFGSLFFLGSIALVLQLIPVGGAILAERYTYVPYIGLFFLLSSLLLELLNTSSVLRKSSNRNVFFAFIAGLLLWHSVLSWNRIEVWENGEKLFTDLLEKQPNLPFAHNNLGYYYYKYEHDLERSLRHYNTCLELDPLFKLAHSNRGSVYFDLQQYEKALRDYTKALELKPDNTDAWRNRATTYSVMDQFNKAIEDYTKYLDFNNDDQSVYIWRGMAYFNLKDYEKAMRDFRKAEEMNAANDEVFYWKAQVYIARGMEEKAIQALGKTLNLNTKRSDAWSWRGMLYKKRGETEKAIDDLNNALRLNPGDVAALVNRAYALRQLGNVAMAYSDLARAAEMGYKVNQNDLIALKNALGN